MESFINIIRQIGPVRLVLMLISLAAIISLFVTLTLKVNKPPLSILYGGLDPQEAQEIAQMLESQGVEYRVENSGAIYVPANRVGELRLQVAGEGLVGPSASGYEIFDEGSSFGTTSLVQNINAKRALEGELARTITAMPSVKSARVHLVLPKKQLFSKDSVVPTASVALSLGSRVVNDEQVSSIVQLVAAAVPNLAAKNITVIDQRGNLLSIAKGSESTVALSAQEKIRRKVEADYENSITRMLEKVVGPGKASVKVAAEMDFDRVEELQESYDPDEQIARSEQRSEENLTSSETNANPAVGVTGNVPGQNLEGTSVGAQENQIRTEETINYEIGKTVRRVVKEGGVLTRLSVAVLVEGDYQTIGDGGETDQYIPLSDEQLGKLESLVKTSIGYDEARGDTVEIVDMPFSVIPEPEEIEPPLFTKAEIVKMVEYGLLVIGMVVLLFMFVRPTLKAISNAAMPPLPQSPEPVAAGAAAGGGSAPAPAETNEAEDTAMVEMDKVQGQVKQSSVKKVAEVVDSYPEETVGVVRAWMAEEKED